MTHAGVLVKNKEIGKHVIKSWNDLPKFCQNLEFNADVTDKRFSIYGMPPKVIFAVPIDTSFKVVCYNHSKLTMV